MQELLDVEGARVSMKHPLTYMKPGETVTAAVLEDRSRRHGEVVVGYVDDELQGTFTLWKTDTVAFDHVHKLMIVTAEDAGA